MAEQTVAGHLAASLPGYGVSHVFELVGGMVTFLIDAMHQNPELTVVSMHHEQGAGFAAEGYTRTSGRPTVAMGTSGPGATNLLTAIGSCYFDSSPVVFITGQVNRWEMRGDRGARQGGFQEMDIVSMAAPVTKWAKLVDDPASFPADLEEAFRVATTGRPGPVLLDIPMDVQRALISSDPAQTEPPASPVASPDGRATFLARVADAFAAAERPLVIAGGGIRSAGQVELFRDAVDGWQVPVATTLMGLDALPATSAYHAGFLGSYGNRWTNWAISASDVVLVLGSRLDVRQTGSDVEGFRGNRTIFHVDIDASELGYHVSGCDTFQDDLGQFLADAATALQGVARPRDGWLAEISERREQWPDTAENVPASGVNPNTAARVLGDAWDDVDVWVTDVGQHQMWAAQSLKLARDQRFLTSGGMGSMGFGLPAAIGAAMAADGPVSLIAGDGGFQCNIQELQTLARLRLPVRLVVMDNGCHGMVRQFQESYFESRFFSTRWGYSAPDFCAVAVAYGIPAWRVDSEEDLARVAAEIRAGEPGPVLVRIAIDEDLNVYPKMAFGREYGSMEPDVKPTEMEGT